MSKLRTSWTTVLSRSLRIAASSRRFTAARN
jgi:hypothetical protein